MGRWRLVSFAGLVALGFGLLFTILMVQVSSRPQFCGSCHVMAPYYESWQTSTHKQVSCVQCHIPPGVESEIEKKKEALSMLVSYFTGTYGTNPWAEIDDAACVACHQHRLLLGKELFGGILFDHGPHLTEMRREKKLRCTSCHSQIVQGSHISVTTSTCILCHFKDQDAGTGLSECTLCHDVPDKVIEKGTLSFNHSDVRRFDMKCSWCHARSTKGDGSAPRQRCYVCHNDPSRLEAYDDHPRLHQIHVTDHKVECLHCHTEIQHGSFEPRKEVAETDCATCHADGHSPQRDLYVGIGGKGVHPRPSAMHLAGIHCEGCHFLEADEQAGNVNKASEVSCMACHGPRYAKMLDRWQTLVDHRLAQSRDLLAYASDRLPATDGTVTDAAANLRLIEHGHGVHNVDYALDILRANHDRLSGALAAAGSRAPAIPWEQIPYDNDCLRCHQGIELHEGEFGGRRFAHRQHIIGAQLECAECHRPHEQREASEKVSLEPEACAPCHHQEDSGFEERCADCHAGIEDRIVPHGDEEFEHVIHVSEEELECLDCHTVEERPGLELDFCVDCHD